MTAATLVDRVRDWGIHRSERRAFAFLQDGEAETDALTFGELDRRARAVATALRGVAGRGDRALLAYPPGLRFIVGFLGCLHAGVIAVPVSLPRPRRGARGLLAILEDARPAVVLSSTSQIEALEKQVVDQGGFRPRHWLATDPLEEGEAALDVGAGVEPGDLAFLQYTSGSTGSPKGVMVTHGGLAHNLELIRVKFEHGDHTVGVGWLPLFHDMGLVGNVLQPLHLGTPGILMPPMAFLQKPSRWLRAISRYRGTTAGAPNFAYALCVEKIPPEERETLDLSSWDVAFNGSEPVRADTLERFSEAFAASGFRPEAFYPCYGMAETTLLAAGGSPAALPHVASFDAAALEGHRLEPASESDPAPRRLVGCGGTALGHRIAIVDGDARRRLPLGRVGEIWLSGPSVARGYWGRPEETRETFGAFLRDAGDGPWLRTGDLGSVHGDHLFVTGRLKDLLIVRGQNHYPHDIERTVGESHPALVPFGGAAFLVEADGGDHLAVVQEVLRSWVRRVDVVEVAGDVREAVAEEHGLHLAALVLVLPGSVPRTSSGKVRRRACRAALVDGGLAEVNRHVLGPLRAHLAR